MASDFHRSHGFIFLSMIVLPAAGTVTALYLFDTFTNSHRIMHDDVVDWTMKGVVVTVPRGLQEKALEGFKRDDLSINFTEITSAHFPMSAVWKGEYTVDVVSYPTPMSTADLKLAAAADAKLLAPLEVLIAYGKTEQFRYDVGASLVVYAPISTWETPDGKTMVPLLIKASSRELMPCTSLSASDCDSKIDMALETAPAQWPAGTHFLTVNM